MLFLTELQCFNFAIIFEKKNDIYLFEKNIKEIISLNFNSIELHIIDTEYNFEFVDKINILANEHLFLHPVLYTNNQKIVQYIYSKQNNRILCESVCNFYSYDISYDSFFCNIMFFTESQHYNTYYHKKIFISKDGLISNMLNSSKNFGNINQIYNKCELIEIIALQDFQLLWYASKEKISICKDCEFRHLCIDRRIPLKRKNDSWYFTTECNYNPYICKWKNEHGYLPLNDCGIICNEHGFSIDKSKLKKVLKNLWGLLKTQYFSSSNFWG